MKMLIWCHPLCPSSCSTSSWPDFLVFTFSRSSLFWALRTKEEEDWKPFVQHLATFELVLTYIARCKNVCIHTYLYNRYMYYYSSEQTLYLTPLILLLMLNVKYSILLPFNYLPNLRNYLLFATISFPCKPINLTQSFAICHMIKDVGLVSLLRYCIFKYCNLEAYKAMLTCTVYLNFSLTWLQPKLPRGGMEKPCGKMLAKLA